MSEPTRYDVFLSYSFKDREWVAQFVSALREAGLTAWFDVAEIAPGENWQEYLQKALRESRTLVVILSPNTVKSSWTFFEVGAAIADKKRIIPVLTQEMELQDIPFLLRRYQFLLAQSPQHAGKRVAEVIAQASSTRPQQSAKIDET